MDVVDINTEELLDGLEFNSREYCLSEAANRAEYFFKKIDGSFAIPKCHPQVQQVLELVIAGALK